MDFKNVKRVAISGFTDPDMEMEFHKRNISVIRFVELVNTIDVLIMKDTRAWSRKKKIAKDHNIPIISREEACAGIGLITNS